MAKAKKEKDTTADADFDFESSELEGFAETADTETSEPEGETGLQLAVHEDVTNLVVGESVSYEPETPAEEDAPQTAMPKTVYKNCRVDLSQKEIVERNAQLMRNYTERNNEIAQFDEIKADHKARLKEFDKEAGRYVAALTSGFEWRDVECIESFNFQKSVVNIYRTDTGDLVETRGMTDKERQKPLFV